MLLLASSKTKKTCLLIDTVLQASCPSDLSAVWEIAGVHSDEAKIGQK